MDGSSSPERPIRARCLFLLMTEEVPLGRGLDRSLCWNTVVDEWKWDDACVVERLETFLFDAAAAAEWFFRDSTRFRKRIFKMLMESTSKARKSRRPVASRKKMEKKKAGEVKKKKKFVCLRNTLMSTDRQASKSRVVRLDIVRRISKNSLTLLWSNVLHVLASIILFYRMSFRFWNFFVELCLQHPCRLEVHTPKTLIESEKLSTQYKMCVGLLWFPRFYWLFLFVAIWFVYWCIHFHPFFSSVFPFHFFFFSLLFIWLNWNTQDKPQQLPLKFCVWHKSAYESDRLMANAYTRRVSIHLGRAPAKQLRPGRATVSTRRGPGTH